MKEEQKHITRNIELLYSSEHLSESDLKDLECWVNNAGNDAHLDGFFDDNWKQARRLVNKSVNQIEKQNLVHFSRRQKLWRLYKQVAAVILFPVIGFLIYWVSRQDARIQQTMTVRTEIGDRAHFFLPDGTEVHMNALSSLAYQVDYGMNNRDVKVTGEVFFNVFKNKQLPFIVQTDSLQIEALGTQFLVRNYQDELFVQSSLIEGKVKVTSDIKEVVLNPGQGIEFSKADHELTKRNVDNHTALAWTKGQLIFSDDDMSQVCRKIEHWYGVTVVVNPDEFKGKTFSLRLRKEETLYNLLAVMSEVMGLNYRLIENKLIINKSNMKK